MPAQHALTSDRPGPAHGGTASLPRNRAPRLHATGSARLEPDQRRACPPAPPCREDLFWLLERIMPRLHERMGGPKPVHVLGIADPASVPQVPAF